MTVSADFGAVPSLVDHHLVSCRVVRVVMALGQTCVGSSLLACNLKCMKICENPLPLFLFYFVSFNPNRTGGGGGVRMPTPLMFFERCT